ncbi:MAG: LptF/LptG family permease [Phycisphaerae bacterium]|nr:LptF/LptG family permease [Phycisphaerae bacterium]
MITLHNYVLRELLKTFVLSVIAMTALFTIGGGVFNVVRYEGVGAAEVFTILPMLIPIFVTFTLPLAALFAVTMVYGRLAADNELVACRAAGINVHRLFASTILLSVFVALFSLVFVNYVIPGMIGQVRLFVRSNVRGIAEQSLRTKGYIAWTRGHGQLFVTAPRAVSNFDPGALRASGWDPKLDYLKVDSPTFLQLTDDGEVERLTTAEYAWVQFDSTKDPVQVFATGKNARDFQVGNHLAHVEEQYFGPRDIVLPFPNNTGFLSLTALLETLVYPWKFDDIADAVDTLRELLLRYHLREYCRTRVESGAPIHLVDGDGRQYYISAATLDAVERGRVQLMEVRVTCDEDDPALPSEYSAPLARVELVGRDQEPRVYQLQVRLMETEETPVTTAHPGSTTYQTARTKTELTIGDLNVPDDVMATLALCTPAALLDPAVDLGVDEPRISEKRAELQDEAVALQREIRSLLHFRFGFGLSALVTILMGAVLGVMFRGNRALAAFGLAAIPFGIAMLLMIMGRQTAEKAGTEILGASIIWGGLIGLAIADCVMIRVGVKR